VQDEQIGGGPVNQTTPTSCGFGGAEVVAILGSARAPEPDARLNDVLEAFRRQWRSIGRRRYPDLGEGLDDIVQEALVKLVDPQRLRALRNPAVVEAWGRSVFVRTALNALRDERPHRVGRSSFWTGDADDEAMVAGDILPGADPGPEDVMAREQRLRLVAETIAGVEVARLKFVDDLSDKEIAARCGLSRDGVAGQLKRIRKRLRTVLGALENGRGS